MKPRPPVNAPNVLLIMTDDVGFGASATFGGPIPTPTFDEVARMGVRYNRFHTFALCSPTRAALLTGRDPHNVAMGNVTNYPTGYDGYTSYIPKSAGTVAETLRQNGYNTAMFGKAHITPEDEISVAGPFDRWPNGLGFEYFYGFLSADTSAYYPSLIENTRTLELPEGDSSYHFERDLADRAIQWLRDQHAAAPDRPFFIYYATGAAHSPHHAPKQWLSNFRGKFDEGWDAMREQTFARQKAAGIIPPDAQLTSRPASLPAWSSLSADQKKLAARLFEAYAASLAYADDQIGRVLGELKRSGQLDNTLIIFVQGDNGGAAEGRVGGELWEQTGIYGYIDTDEYMLSRLDEIGGPTLYTHFPAAWAWAQSTPFQYFKQVASHFGGIRNPLAIAWPRRIKPDGEIRGQFHAVDDIMPTVLDAAGIRPLQTIQGVTQQPLDGVSMAYTFSDPKAGSRKRMQVFEMMENLGIYKDGWWAGTVPGRVPWSTAAKVATPLLDRPWELYHVDEDFSQARELSSANPAKLAEMKAEFWAGAARRSILPVHSSREGAEGRPQPGFDRNPAVFTAPIARLPEALAPQLIGRSFTIDVDVVIPPDGGHGVLVTQGGMYGGYAFYLNRGKLVFYYNATGPRQYRVESRDRIAVGHRVLSADFVEDPKGPAGTGQLTLKVDGQPVGSGRIIRGRPLWISHTEGFDVGQDSITPINEDYRVSTSRFSGTLNRITVTRK